MRILFLDAYFEPERIAFTHLEKDLLEGLVNSGYEVEIVCPTPTRNVSADVVNEYKKKKKETLYNGHVHVTRFFAPQEGKNPIIRALRYFWCNFRTYQIGKRMKNIDVVFSNSTPPTQGWIAGKVARKLKTPFIYSLQDVFPDSLVTTELTKKASLLWKVGRKLENSTYNLCTNIIVVSESMRKNLLEKGVHEDKLQVISNWIDLDSISPITRNENELFDEFGINREKFIVLYAGNFGAAQGAEIILNVAKELESESDIQFVIFGGGTGYEKAVEKAKTLSNVFIHTLLPPERISEVYSMGDVALITCKKGVGKSGMPSKTWSIMACNTPIIASFDLDSELACILEKSKAGVCIEAENIEALKNNILQVRAKNNLFVSLGRSYIEENANKKKCVKTYEEIIQKCG